MNTRQERLKETFASIAGPLARLRESLHDDEPSVTRNERDKSAYDRLATDAFLQRFQQFTDLALRKLMPRLLAVLEDSDTRHPFGAVFDRLDGYEILSDVPWWIKLNEVRNRLIHEYAMGLDERTAEMARAWSAAAQLCNELTRIREDRALAERLFPND